MSTLQRTISMGSTYPSPSPSTSPLVHRQELPEAAQLFKVSNIIAPVKTESSAAVYDAEEWKSWIYPEYIVPELDDDLPTPPLPPIDPGALDVLLGDSYAPAVQPAHAEEPEGMRIDGVFQLPLVSGDMVVDSSLAPAEPLAPSELQRIASIGAPSVVTGRVALLDVNLNLCEPPDVLTSSKPEPTPPTASDILGTSLSHGVENIPVPSAAIGARRTRKSTCAARNASSAPPERRSSRIKAIPVALRPDELEPVPQLDYACPQLGCTLSFARSCDLKRHRQIHDPTTLSCRVCLAYNVGGDRKDALLRHQRETERCKELQRGLSDGELHERGCITREERRLLAPKYWLD